MFNKRKTRKQSKDKPSKPPSLPLNITEGVRTHHAYYNGDLQSSFLPTFEDRTEFTSKKQTEHERYMREENFKQISNLPQLTVEITQQPVLTYKSMIHKTL